MKSNFTFIAEDNFKYISIGNFKDDADSEIQQFDDYIVAGAVYYYIDEVCLVKQGDNCSISTFTNVQFSRQQYIEIYPNPSSNGIFNIDIIGNDEGNIILDMHDAKGVNVYNTTLQENVGQHVIDISSLARGLYYLTISTQDDRQVRKIIKH
ncbi:MAG: hypothetical protein ACI8YQ_000181 [Polaribacter sp.]|jgi:hypothetical protein